MEFLSPELALVDERLAERARRLLPEPGDCLALVPRPAPTPVVSAPRRRPRQARPSEVVVVAAVLASSLLGSPVVDLFPAKSDARLPVVAICTPDTHPDTTTDRAPRPGLLSHLVSNERQVAACPPPDRP